jgi:hypothetical protein
MAAPAWWQSLTFPFLRVPAGRGGLRVQELAMRRTELEKIDTLEDKIKLELTQLSDRQTGMEKEITEFGSVSGRRVATSADVECARMWY